MIGEKRKRSKKEGEKGKSLVQVKSTKQNDEVVALGSSLQRGEEKGGKRLAQGRRKKEKFVGGKRGKEQKGRRIDHNLYCG